MKAKDVLKFIKDRYLEYHWNNNKDDVYLFVPIGDISDFNKLLGIGIYEDEGVSCIMKSGYFCFEMQSICSSFGIELKEIFKK